MVSSDIVVRPGRAAEVGKATPMTLKVNEGNLARWEDALGG